MSSFEGKVILITGASSGIGAACAEYFAAKGALLSLVGRNPDKFANLLEKLIEDGIETEPHIIYADVSVDTERIITETIDKYDHLDVLVNNAGFNIPANLDTMKMEDYDSMMSTNVRAVVELSKLATPYLIETKGCIVNVSSITGIISIPEIVGYSMTKAALDQFTKCAAMELAPKGVRVNSVNPGYIETDFYTNSTGIEKDSEEYIEYTERRRLNQPIQLTGTVDDCVRAISFLADNENAKFITAVLLRVDGGVSAKASF